MAQAKFEPTKEQRENVELLAAVGTVHPLIARMILKENGKPISTKTLTRHFKDELELGLAKANGIVGGKLFEMAISGNHDACTMFWMKTRAGWRETNVQQNQHLDKDGNAINPPSFGISWSDGGPGQPGPTSDPAAQDSETGLGETEPEYQADTFPSGGTSSSETP
jgi:hypothetical protein